MNKIKTRKEEVEINSELLKTKISLEPQEIIDFLKQLVPDAFKDGIGILNDNMKYYRRKNQINILKKTEKILEEKNIKPSKIPLKILIPILDTSSLEEDELLQNKWAEILSFAVASKEFEYTKTFMHILDQLTPLEAGILDWIYRKYKTKNNNKFRIKDISDAMNLKAEKTLIIIDNFLRLRLIKQEYRGQNISSMVNIQPSQIIVLTDLGKKFLKICEGDLNV